MLLQYQKDNLEKLTNATKDTDEVVVVGSTNSGRKYVINQWGNDLPKSIVIQLKEADIKLPYASLITALKEVELFRKKTPKITPVFTIAGGLGSVDISLESALFYKNEDEIIKRLLGLAKHHTIVFIIDKSFSISDGSIELIEKFKIKCKKKYRPYIVYVSNIKKSGANNIHFDDLASCSLTPIELMKELNYDPNIALGDKAIDFIFKNINNNIELLIQIINDINNGSLP